MVAESSSVLHSWCVQADWNAPTVVGGEGASFWDESGRTYLDMSSLAECMNLGHQHPRLIRAILGVGVNFFAGLPQERAERPIGRFESPQLRSRMGIASVEQPSRIDQAGGSPRPTGGRSQCAAVRVLLPIHSDIISGRFCGSRSRLFSAATAGMMCWTGTPPA